MFITDPVSNNRNKKGGEKLVFLPLLVATNITKLIYIFTFKHVKKKKFGQFTMNYNTFYQNNCQALKYGFGIRDPRLGIREKPIPDPGVKKALDFGSGSETLVWSFTSGQYKRLHFTINGSS
jgi:hypothetical protein